MLVFFTNLSLMDFHVRYLALSLLFLILDSFKWFWMESLYKNIQLMLEFVKAPFLVLHFSRYTLMIFLMMLSVILDWDFYSISIVKTASKKIGALIHFMKFLSPEVALYLYKSTIHHVWNNVALSRMEFLDQLQK